MLKRKKKNRPAINLEIREVRHDKQKIWGMFAKYHYLNHSFNATARTFVCYANGHLAAFTSALHFMHPKKKNTVRGHRSVVFPDYQGVGIGVALTTAVADYFQRIGKTYITTTSNPAMIIARGKDPRWAMTRRCRASNGSETGKIQNKFKRGSTSCARITCAFEYIGEKRNSVAPVASKSKRR